MPFFCRQRWSLFPGKQPMLNVIVSKLCRITRRLKQPPTMPQPFPTTLRALLTTLRRLFTIQRRRITPQRPHITGAVVITAATIAADCLAQAWAGGPVFVESTEGGIVAGG